MRSPARVLNSLTKHSQTTEYRFERLYRILFNEEMYYLAYQRIYAKPGNMTQGADGKTIDRMSLSRIEKLIASLKDESYSPQPLGFRIAVFGFADFGLIGYSPNIFKNDFFTSFGVGVRLRNERLVFNTVQIRLGIAFGKRGLVESEYFRLSNATRVEQYRYRPTRPEIVGFK